MLKLYLYKNMMLIFMFFVEATLQCFLNMLILLTSSSFSWNKIWCCRKIKIEVAFFDHSRWNCCLFYVFVLSHTAKTVYTQTTFHPRYNPRQQVICKRNYWKIQFSVVQSSATLKIRLTLVVLTILKRGV